MARIVANLTIENRGVEEGIASLQTIIGACEYADLDPIEIAIVDGRLCFNGTAVTEFAQEIEQLHITTILRPTAAMEAFVSWLTERLPSTVTVRWRDGWPYFLKPVPVRLEVDAVDFDYDTGQALHITFDGEDMYGRATAYDLDAQTVTRCKLNEKGEPYAEGDRVALETVEGKVAVEWTADAPLRVAAFMPDAA